MAQDEAAPATYPKFKTLRFDEDWSKFDPANYDGYWDDIKHHNLSNDGENWVGMGGELRYRTESWKSFGFSAAPTADDTFGIGRVQLYTDWNFGSNFRIFIEGESAFASDRDFGNGAPRGIDVDQFDLQNAFADIIFPFGDSKDKLTLRLGRQGLSFGKQRLVSTLPWANSQRSWDGGRAILNIDDWRIDGFYTRYTPWLKYQFNDWRLGPDFWGVYATGKIGEKNSIGVDVYYLGIEYDTARTYTITTTGIENRHTFGGRLFGKFGDSGFGYDVEGAYQFGEVGTADINAYMFATQLSYAFKDSDWNPKMYVGFDYSSGDDTAGDNDVETFNQLFPLGHAFNGFMDLIGRQNIQDISAGFSFKPHKKFLVKADYHIFSRSSDSDDVYNAGGGVLRATTVGASDDVGQEIDITVKYLVDRHLTLQVGYSHFFTGDYFTDTAGGDENVDFFYFQAVYKF
ncbi:MAG: alginate export family protein [Phycisphaerales bacterium]|nr:alginate export family protein [Phycisphaerales bacterium]